MRRKSLFYLLLAAVVLCVCLPPFLARRTGIEPDAASAQPEPVVSEVQDQEPVQSSVAIAPKRDAKEIWDFNLEQACELMTQDPEAVFAWVEQLPLREDREEALKKILPQLAQSDPANAMEAAWRMELGKWGGEGQRAALEQVAYRWATSDLNSAFAWAWKLPAGEDGRRNCVIKGMVSAVATVAPADAARLVAEQMTPDGTQFRAALEVISKWSTQDMAAARAWVDAFPDGLREMAQAKLESQTQQLQ